MIQVHRLDSLDQPGLEPYRTMRRQEEQREQGIFVAESDKVVQRLIESSLSVVSLLLPERWFYRLEPLLAKRKETIDVYLLEKRELERLTGFSFYQGVLAIGKVPNSIPLSSLLQTTPAPRLFAAVEGLTNAENLGSLARSGAAFGLQALLVDRQSCSPYLRRAVRASMGAVFHLPVLENLDLVETVRHLQEEGIRCVAAHPPAREATPPDADFSKCTCLFFGSEGYGLSPEVLAACDESVAIPMAPVVDSLNVGSAAAVFFYEVCRQRTAANSVSRAR